MRGFLSLEPDDETLQRLVTVQNRLRDAIGRQGVHFPDRLGATLLAWPFATIDELDLAVERLDVAYAPAPGASAVGGRPNDDRPAEVGVTLLGLEGFQATLFESLKEALDPDPPKPAFLRLARVSPPSRKVGAALRGSGLRGKEAPSFRAKGLAFWTQTPQGFDLHRAISFRHE